MKRTIIKTVLAAAALSTAIAGSSAFAQSYGAGPTCGYRQANDATNWSCMSLIRQGGDSPRPNPMDHQYPKQIDVVE